MSLRQTVHDKILTGIFKAQTEKGKWKVLVLDEFSKNMISACCKMHEVIDQGITLIEDINKRREPLPALEAVYLVNPSEKAVATLMADFRSPDKCLYKAAHVYFLKACAPDLFNQLCKSRCNKYIQTLKEINMAYLPYESQVFSLGIPEAFLSFHGATSTPGSNWHLDRCAEQLATLCASLGEFPAIRYKKSKHGTEDFAELVKKHLELYKADDPAMGEGPQKDRSTLLILDRGFDPISPLLHEMTFQAMAYDLLNIENGVYMYSNANEEDNSIKECVLDEYDEMWTELRHQHIAVVSQMVVKRMRQFAEDKHMKLSEKTSVRDLNKMLKQAPEHQRELTMYSAHFHLAEDCMRQYKSYVNKLCLVEQGLAMGTDSEGERIRDQLKAMNPILLNESLSARDKIRLIMLYIIHQGGTSEENLERLMQHAGIPVEDACVITNAEKLGIPIICDDVKSKASQPYQCTNRKERPHEDVYETSRWTPYLRDIMEDVIEDRLDRQKFPMLSPGMAGKSQSTGARSARQGGNPDRHSKPGGPRLIVFILGGVAFSEMRAAYTTSHETQHWEVILGGTHVMSPQTYLDNLHQLNPGPARRPNNGTAETFSMGEE